MLPWTDIYFPLSEENCEEICYSVRCKGQLYSFHSSLRRCCQLKIIYLTILLLNCDLSFKLSLLFMQNCQSRLIQSKKCIIINASSFDEGNGPISVMYVHWVQQQSRRDVYESSSKKMTQWARSYTEENKEIVLVMNRYSMW